MRRDIAMQLPDWLEKEEQYIPDKDRDYFISRSFLRITGILARYESAPPFLPDKLCPSPMAAMLFLLLLLLLIVTSSQPYFLYTVAALLLALLALQDGRRISRLLLPSLLAALFSLFILLPAILMTTNPLTLLLPVKTFLTVLASGIFTGLYPWNRITAAISWFHVPQLAIFILDTALRYIYLLGSLSREFLTALQLRSIGQNRQKSRAMAGVVGNLFLKSQEMSQEMYHAMQCRGFTGTYPHSHQRAWQPADIVLLLTATALLFIYLRLEMLL